MCSEKYFIYFFFTLSSTVLTTGRPCLWWGYRARNRAYRVSYKSCVISFLHNHFYYLANPYIHLSSKNSSHCVDFAGAEWRDVLPIWRNAPLEVPYVTSSTFTIPSRAYGHLLFVRRLNYFRGSSCRRSFGEAWSFASWWVIHALTRYDVQVYCGWIPSSHKSLDDVKKKRVRKVFFFTMISGDRACSRKSTSVQEGWIRAIQLAFYSLRASYKGDQVTQLRDAAVRLCARGASN